MSAAVRDPVQSRYPEDVLVGGHAAVYGSYYCGEARRWGFACCRVFDRSAPCSRSRAEAAPQASGDGSSDSEAGSEEGERPSVGDRDASGNLRLQGTPVFVPRSECSSPEEFVDLAVGHLIFLWRGQEAKGFPGRRGEPSLLESFGHGVLGRTEVDLAAIVSALRERRLPEDVVGNLERAVVCTFQRDFTGSLKAYMDIAIGKAKWQIGGVSMWNQQKMRVVKHQEDHFLAREDQRRGMNALKRLLAFAESTLPPLEDALPKADDAPPGG